MPETPKRVVPSHFTPHTAVDDFLHKLTVAGGTRQLLVTLRDQLTPDPRLNEILLYAAALTWFGHLTRENRETELAALRSCLGPVQELIDDQETPAKIVQKLEQHLTNNEETDRRMLAAAGAWLLHQRFQQFLHAKSD
jgi:hypothetical protein